MRIEKAVHERIDICIEVAGQKLYYHDIDAIDIVVQ